MKQKNNRKEITIATRVIIVVASLALIFAFALAVRYLDQNYDNTAPPLKDKMGMTIYGEIVCLPHKGDGPHTMECTYGLKDSEGNHFALIDTQPQNVPESGSEVKIDGVFVPVNEEDESHSYDIVGSIRYARIQEVE